MLSFPALRCSKSGRRRAALLPRSRPRPPWPIASALYAAFPGIRICSVVSCVRSGLSSVQVMSRPSLCLLVTTTPQERPLRGLCSAGPTAARLLSQAASRPRVSQGTANQRLPGITPASPTTHATHAASGVSSGSLCRHPHPTPAQLCFPGRHSLGAQAQSRPAHSPPESHAQLPLLTGPCHRFLEPRLPGMWDCHAAPCPPAWHLGPRAGWPQSQGTGSSPQLARREPQ